MRLSIWSRYLIGLVIALAIIMTMILGLHLFGGEILRFGLYSQLFGALLGGLIVLISVNIPIHQGEEAEPWLGHERLAWCLIGSGAILWGLGECVYRYLLAHNLPNFPALSDVGYAALPPLMFLGLLLQPSSESVRARLLVVLDSLISMGSIFAIAWYLLLGSMAQAPGEANLAKFLGLYYPITDLALVSCVVFLIVRGQGRSYEATARRMGLILVGTGLCIFAVSDFNYNLQNNFSTYVDGTWADLGWPFGLMLIGVAAHLRRFLPATSDNLVEERLRSHEQQSRFGPGQLLPYFLLGALFLVLTLNVLSTDAVQIWNRPVLLVTTLGVVSLVIVRQLNTQLENERLMHKQELSLARLASANAQIEEQARQIAEHNLSLEDGIAQLKEVQAQIANGNLRARARIFGGSLVSLAGSLNIMADRLLRYEQVDAYAQRLTHALQDLSRAFEIYRTSGTFTLPLSCSEFPEIQRLLLSMGIKYAQSSLPAERHVRPASQGLKNAPISSLPPLPGSPRPVSGQISQRSVSAPLPVSEDRSEQVPPTWPPSSRRSPSSNLPLSGNLDPGRPGSGKRE